MRNASSFLQSEPLAFLEMNRKALDLPVISVAVFSTVLIDQCAASVFRIGQIRANFELATGVLNADALLHIVKYAVEIATVASPAPEQQGHAVCADW